ncbi:hypothetical protein Ahy_B01g055382 isoform C [Arachis hypogaea]|uniref:Uncharacterized protein n=1 Tax=Arachis hypogaea TaxID=3818 RepID=A0A445AW53_ARAHY|nr:hypothetical protein Ahy_B01g055382 isoform C [Arachis hypogaea]
MAIVYEQHYKTVGPFSGTAYITVLLDRTDDRSLRHRPLFLLKALMKDLANVEAYVLVGACVLAVNLLTVVHEALERTAIPLQSNLIAATDFMEPLKEWMYIDKEDDAGEIVTPTPGVKRILSSPCCLPHIAQELSPCLLTLSYLVQVVYYVIVFIFLFIVFPLLLDPKAMIRLYSTSAFYFALAYPGSNLLSIGQLFTVTLVHQGFHGGEEAAVSASLPLAKRSVLGGLLPESLLYVLKRSGPAAFAAAMVSDSDTPEIIWTHKMRAENLIRQVLQHLGDFPQKLSQYCHVLYDYAPMPPVTYPELRDEMLPCKDCKVLSLGDCFFC